MTDGRAGARSDPGKVRENNEDRWLVRRSSGVMLLAVADGVGGEQAGEAASGAAIDALEGRFFDALPAGGAREALASAIRDANDAVLKGQTDRGDAAATTLVACAVRGREAVVANLGDSRAYLVRAGSARQVTEDHAGMTPNQITRFVGDPRGVQPDVFVEMLRGGDRVVLCSDGLTRHVEDSEIASIARSADPLAAADELVRLANERGGEDNITVVVFAPRRGAAARYARALLVVLVALLLVAVTIVAYAVTTGWRPPPPPL